MQPRIVGRRSLPPVGNPLPHACTNCGADARCQEHRQLNNVLVFGPFVLPFALLLVFATVASTFYVGKRCGRKADIDVETVLWKTLLVGLIVARLAFVWEFRSAYLASPLIIIDIRDGGWNPTAGFVGAWLFALSRKGRMLAMEKPLRFAMMAGTVVWVVGALALSMKPGTGQELPALNLTSLEGRSTNLAEFKGKPTVVNLWATWCPPCVREMPVLHQAQAERPTVNFVFLNQGESAARVSGWLQARQLPLRNVLLDANRHAGAAFMQSALPTTLFFDAEGRLVSTRVGELSAATLSERLQALAD